VFTIAPPGGAIALNLKSVWLCMQQEIRQMLAQDRSGVVEGSVEATEGIDALFDERFHLVGLGYVRWDKDGGATNAGTAPLRSVTRISLADLVN
jgi:hypothetical protein